MALIKKVLFLIVLTVALGQMAQADPIASGTLSLTNCGTLGTGCPAATYSFEIGTNSATLTITITGGLTADNNLIGGVDLGFSSVNLTSITGSTTAPGTWLFSQDSLSSNGCGPNSGKAVCSTISVNPSTGGAQLLNGTSYSWTWNYDTISAGSIFSAGDVHIGANYNPANGLIVSQTINTAVPEPNSLLLLGGGLIGLAGVFRRKLML